MTREVSSPSFSTDALSSREDTAIMYTHLPKEALPPDAPHHFTLPTISAFLLLGAIWGSAFAFIKVAVDTFAPFTLVMFRLVVGSFFMFVISGIALYRDYKVRKNLVYVVMTPKTLAKLAFMGLVNNAIPFVLVAWAEQRIASGVASIIDAAIPLFAQLFAHFFLSNERINRHKSLGLFVGFVGVVLVCLQGVVDNRQGSGLAWTWDSLSGYIMVTIATASYGIASVFARAQLTDVDGRLASTWQVVFAMIYCTLGHFFIYGSTWYEIVNASQWAWISIIYLGVLSTGVAYLLYFYLISTVGSIRQSMVGYLLPVFGVFDGAMFLSEWVGVSFEYIAIEVIGTLLICSGITMASKSKSTK